MSPEKGSAGTAKLKRIIKEKDREIEILKQVTFDIYRLNLEEILKRMIETAVGITACDAAFLYIVDESKENLVLRAAKSSSPEMIGHVKLKMGEGMAGWVAEHKRPVAVSTDAFKDPRLKVIYPEDRYQAILSVPILSRDEIVGVINVRHKKKTVYKPNIISLLFTAATQLGGALENARLQDINTKKEKEIVMLSEISRSIVSGRYLEEILNLIVTVTAEVLGSKICSIMMIDENNEELKIIATQSLSPAYKNKPNLKIGQSVSGKVVKSKKPVSVPDVTKDPTYIYGDIAKREGLVSMLAVPMLVRGKAIGVINVYTSHRHNFTNDEIRILQSVANQSAMGIENMNLKEEAQIAKEALETRKLVERAKGILMKRFHLNEDDAYKTIHKKSMDSRKSMKEVAEAIILTTEMEKK